MPAIPGESGLEVSNAGVMHNPYINELCTTLKPRIIVDFLY